MNVTLDRVYDFLHGVSNHDIIMYHWYPHGSKKLDDLKMYLPEGKTPSWYKLNRSPAMICHDQEPLHYDFYTPSSLRDYFFNSGKGRYLDYNSPLMDLMVANHLKGISFFNGHDQFILCHSEKNSKDLQQYQDNGFVGVYYWSHGIIARDWYRFAEHDARLQKANYSKMFLANNRAWSGTREYRLKFAELLVDRNLSMDVLMRFSEFDNGQHYQDHLFCNQHLKICRSDLQNHFEQNNHNANSSADYSAEDYQQCRIEVVLETMFDDTRIHLTEKILRPIACGKPFMLASTPHSLKYLRDYGFETFSPWINETYDIIEDSADRLEAIVAEMSRLKNLSESELAETQAAINAIAQRNKDLFFSQQWFDSVVNEYKSNLDSAIDQVANGPRGKNWRALGEIIHTIPMLQKYYNNEWPGVRTKQEMDEYLSWINFNK